VTRSDRLLKALLFPSIFVILLAGASFGAWILSPNQDVLASPRQLNVSAQACGGNSTVDILGAHTAAGARNFLVHLQTAVKSNDRKRIAGMVNYPLLVLHSERRMHIRRKEALLADYNRIFTATVRDAILHQSAQCLFGNSSGAMIGEGEVWFREQKTNEWKIITINESISGH